MTNPTTHPVQEAAEGALSFARETLDEAKHYCTGKQWSPSMAEQCDRAIARIDAVLSAAPAEPAASGVPAAPWPDFLGQPIHHGDRLTHPDGNEFVAVRLNGFDHESNAWRAVYDHDAEVSRLCLQIGDKGQAVLVAAPSPPQPVEQPSAQPVTLQALYRRALSEANGLTNYVEDRPELRRAEKRLEAIEAEARTLAACSQPPVTTGANEMCQPNGLMFDAFGEPRKRYVRVTLDGSHCVMRPSEGDTYLADAKQNGDDSSYTTADVYLSEREFEDLPDFDGF